MSEMLPVPYEATERPTEGTEITPEIVNGGPVVEGLSNNSSNEDEIRAESNIVKLSHAREYRLDWMNAKETIDLNKIAHQALANKYAEYARNWEETMGFLQSYSKMAGDPKWSQEYQENLMARAMREWESLKSMKEEISRLEGELEKVESAVWEKWNAMLAENKS